MYSFFSLQVNYKSDLNWIKGVGWTPPGSHKAELARRAAELGLAEGVSTDEAIAKYQQMMMVRGKKGLYCVVPILKRSCWTSTHSSFSCTISSRWSSSSSSSTLQSRWRPARRFNKVSTWTPWRSFTSRGRRPSRLCRKSPPPPPHPPSNQWRRNPALPPPQPHRLPSRAQSRRPRLAKLLQ